MPAIPLTIGDKIFASKTAADDACKAILHRYPIGDIVSDGADHAFLWDVLMLHPRADEKVGVGIVRFEVRRNPKYPSRRSFFLIRTDGSETDFGYGKCLDPPSPEREVDATLRHLVTDQIQDFLRRAFSAQQIVHCAASGVVIAHPNDAHVDHAPPTFFELVARFIVDAGGPSRFTLARADGQIGARLADDALAARWLEFHRQNAKLQVVTIKANLSDLRRRRPRTPG